MQSDGETLPNSARNLWRLLPRCPGSLHARIEPIRRIAGIAVRRRQALHLADDRFVFRHACLEIRLVPVLVPIKETIAGRAEPVPDLVRLRFPYRADRLPLSLQSLDCGSRGLPLRGISQSLSLTAQRFLPLEIGRPLILATLQMLLPSGEETVTHPPKAFPDSPFLATGHRADRLPLRLDALDLCRGLNPLGGIDQRFNGRDKLLLLKQIRRTQCGLLSEI